ncbi:hypothetical protein [Parasphingorhabdus sp.]|uniref:hypothetical protein n=1 Tax=Parasphingorhabdus sp. TaxID=2709688 RepID=UPI003001A460
MSKLLRYLVDYKLQDDDRPLTAYGIAVDALGRDDGFDTQADSYPRVQMGRLRRMLDHFYLREDSENRLSIPYSNYEIVVSENETISPASQELAVDRRSHPEAPPADNDTAEPEKLPGWFQTLGFHPRRPTYMVVAITSFFLVAIGASYFTQGNSAGVASKIDYPAVVLESPEGMVNDAARDKIRVIRSHLVGALNKFDQTRIFDSEAAPTVDSQYLLETSILNETGERTQLRLVDSITREVIWSTIVEARTNEALEEKLDKAVVEIASPYGKIAQHELSKFRGDFTPGYPCVLQFHQYMRYRQAAILKPSLSCMQTSAERFPNDAYLMSLMVEAKNIATQLDQKVKIRGSGREIAQTAVRLDPTSASATFAVAQDAFLDSDCRKGAAWGERAVNLNPLSSQIMGHLGMFMLACKLPDGETYAIRALEMDPNADLAIAATVAIQKMRKGDARGAYELSLNYMNTAPGMAPGLEISHMLSAAALGKRNEARNAWRRFAERSGYPETAASRVVFERWIANPDIVRELEMEFEKADLY